MVKPVFFLLFIILACGKNKQNSELNVVSSQIVGGQVVNDNEFSNVVELSINRNGKGYICSGTIIAKDLVLTAAHCLKNEGSPYQSSPENFRIYLRSRMNGVTKTYVFKPSFILKHPMYKDGSKKEQEPYDLGLMKFTGVDFSKYTTFDPLASAVEINALLLKTTEVEMVGYGIKENGQAGTILNKVKTVLGRRDADFLFFLEEFKNIRGGDSGGPVFIKNSAGERRQIGIASLIHNRMFDGAFVDSTFVRADKVEPFLKRSQQILGELEVIEKAMSPGSSTFTDKSGHCKDGMLTSDNLNFLKLAGGLWQEPTFIFDLSCDGIQTKAGLVLLTSFEGLTNRFFDQVEMDAELTFAGEKLGRPVKVKIPSASHPRMIEIVENGKERHHFIIKN